MEVIWRKGVLLTANLGRGDGTQHMEVGYVTTAQSKQLRELEDRFHGTVQITHYVNVHGEDSEPKPSGEDGCKLLEYVKWWLLGGDEEEYERTKDLPLDQFEEIVRNG